MAESTPRSIVRPKTPVKDTRGECNITGRRHAIPTYVTLVNFTLEGLKNVGTFGDRCEQGVKTAEQIGIKTVGAYGLLGSYDMMFIYEEPNERIAASMPLSFAPDSGAQTETWTSPKKEFVGLTEMFKP